VGQLPGRVAVVTGGGRGIGRAIALRYAREGASVVISSRTQSDLGAVAAQIAEEGGAPALAVVADASDRVDARRPVLEAIERLGRVDVLVNNVGGTVGRHHDPFTGDDESFERTLTLNLTSAWWTTREALPGMRERGFGRVISIGSGASKHAAASLSYTTAKHALVGFTKQLAQTAGRTGITVNLLCPGWTNTSLLDFEAVARRAGTTGEGAIESAESENAQHRVLEADELTGMATLLASDDGAGVTGQFISVDGGSRL
jgi:NAD(P)-dependent dehydrogenase (short-subunit alcohol dehydrogenase family)